MNQTLILYHLARADFLERVRRYSFLITLGAVVFLGYQAAVGNIYIRFGGYRGEFNSAWVGSMMAILASFFLSWLGFYLVKGSVAHDRETGVGQILATTPLTRPMYTFGKWLSNFAVLVSMLIILAVAGIFIQILAGEDRQLELAALFTPFIFVAIPMMALTAALAVLFETIGFLSGGLGNVIYFFLFAITFPALGDILSRTNPALEPLGIGLMQQSMGVAAKAAFPGYDGGFMLGSSDAPILGVFHWSGVEWSAEIILKRLLFFGIGVAVALLASLFFDRFDPSRRRPRRTKSATRLSKPETVLVQEKSSQTTHLTPVIASSTEYTFIKVLSLELKLLLKGQRWWWYVIAGGLVIASLVSTPENVRASVLPITWLWPILVWSGMGSREIRHNTQQIAFSSPAPLMRQLPAQWLAGFIVAVLIGSGAALKLLASGDWAGLLAWFSAALFIPSFALALGVWSNSHKLFEVLQVSIWYLAMNKLYVVDYFGANSTGNIWFFIPFSIALIAVSFIGRKAQLQH
jgi:hypothetical protein